MILKRVWGTACVLACGALAACGGDEPGGGFVNIAPTDATLPQFVRDSGMDAAAPSKGPIVTIMQPLPSSDPLVGPVLTGASVDVLCEVKQRPGSAAIDPSTVQVKVFPGVASVPTATFPGVNTGTDLYTATVPLDGLPTGRIRIECSARDRATTNPQQTSATTETFYDGGPIISFTTLNEMSVVSRGKDRATVSIQFKVDPARLSDGDVQAEPGQVKLAINDREVALMPPVSGEYKYELNFSDFFGEAPVESFTLAVTATNKRMGVSATSKKQLIVRVDGVGPTIKVLSPAANGIVGGTVTVLMEITDGLAGVAQGSDSLYALILYLNDQVQRYAVVPDSMPNRYRLTFEASAFPSTRDIVAQLHAFDKAGNETEFPHAMRLDTVPPFVSLDPEDFVDIAGSPPQCSAPFDPLGISPRDGEVVLQNARFRALVWERAIYIPGSTEVFFSGVRDDSVTFYGQDDPSVPLLSDKDKDGVCDTVNFSQELGDKAPMTRKFGPIAPGGPLPGPGAARLGMNGEEICRAAPAPTNPQPRCSGSEMIYVTKHTAAGPPIPVVYGNAVTSQGVGCTGTSFDLTGNAGWHCVAVAARDLTAGGGNLGVSKPVRVCRKLKETDCEGKAEGELLQPPATLTCTDGCTLPSVWTSMGGR